MDGELRPSEPNTTSLPPTPNDDLFPRRTKRPRDDINSPEIETSTPSSPQGDKNEPPRKTTTPVTNVTADPLAISLNNISPNIRSSLGVICRFVDQCGANPTLKQQGLVAWLHSLPSDVSITAADITDKSFQVFLASKVSLSNSIRVQLNNFATIPRSTTRWLVVAYETVCTAIQLSQQPPTNPPNEQWVELYRRQTDVFRDECLTDPPLNTPALEQPQQSQQSQQPQQPQPQVQRKDGSSCNHLLRRLCLLVTLPMKSHSRGELNASQYTSLTAPLRRILVNITDTARQHRVNLNGFKAPALANSEKSPDLPFPSCEICFEYYETAGLKEPCVLPCGHSLCLECATKNRGEIHSTPSCPFCKSSETRFSKNYGLIQVVEILQEKQRENETATNEQNTTSL